MGTGQRPLLLIAALLSAVLGLFAVAHDHDDAASLPCSVCLAAQATDIAPPDEPRPLVAAPLPEPVARAFVLVLAVRPATVVTPPGRAPPHAR